jgi:predicted MPP superfamily phosphohydrolase
MPDFINLLHLSDLHFGMEGDLKIAPTAIAQRKNALEPLITFVSGLDMEWRPQMIAISGDIGWRGGPSDYTDAKKFIETLLKALGLDCDRLVLCAGNHDIDRSMTVGMLPPPSAEYADEWLRIENIKNFLRLFDAYAAFCKDMSLPELRVGSTEQVIIGQRDLLGVRFVSLNSAWFCRGNDDRGNLWIGLPQLELMHANEQLADPVNYDESLITIALLHHPSQHLNDNENNVYGNRLNTYRYLAERSHLILSGHVHGAVEKATRHHGRAYGIVNGATYANGAYRNNFSLLRISIQDREVIRRAFEYDPRFSRWVETEGEKLFIRHSSPPGSALTPGVGSWHLASKFDLRQYYNTLTDSYQRLDLEGLTPPDREEYLQVQLRSVFVQPSVRDNPPPFQYPKELLQKLQDRGQIHQQDLPEANPLEDVLRVSEVYYQKTPRPVLEILTDGHHRSVILLGDPGSGKSTLLRYILLSIADPSSHRNPLASAFADFLPILIELRRFAARRLRNTSCETFLDFLNYLENTEGYYPDRQTLEEYLRSGRAVVLFDGLDEIFDSAERELIAQRIAAFRSNYPKARLIVTSRIIGYPRKILTEAGFEHFTLQDLSAEQIGEFITHWYKIAYHDRPTDALDRRDRIMRAITDSSSIRQLAGNPMLLTIMAIIGKHQELPRERWKLYEHASNVLIQHWDINRHLEDHSLDAGFIDEEDKQEMLRRLAYKMQGASGGLAGNYIYKDELKQEFETYFRERYNTAPERAKEIALAMIQQFHERNFILSLRGAGLYGFVHRAFLEYFCASAYVHRFEKTQKLKFEDLKHEAFGAHWGDQAWHEVLRLISGLVAGGFTHGIISYLAERLYTEWPRQEEFGSQPPWNFALAIQCLAEVKNLSLATEPGKQLLRKICFLFDHDMKGPPQLFQFFREQIIPHAMAIGPAWPGRGELASLLRERGPQPYAYIYDRQAGTFFGAVGRGDAEVHRAVLEYAEHDNAEIRVLAPFALAVGWHDDLMTCDRLEAFARYDRHETVRYAANYALSEHYHHRPETLDVLREQAGNDSHGFDRAAAISGLAKHFHADRDTFGFLCRRIKEETLKYPRTVITIALGEYFSDRPETFQLLLEVARTDPSPGPDESRTQLDPRHVREAALEAVVRFWPNQPDTLALLRDRAANDPTPWLREIATEMMRKLQP